MALHRQGYLFVSPSPSIKRLQIDTQACDMVYRFTALRFMMRVQFTVDGYNLSLEEI
jgi:hypothetical protein